MIFFNGSSATIMTEKRDVQAPKNLRREGGDGNGQPPQRQPPRGQPPQGQPPQRQPPQGQPPQGQPPQGQPGGGGLFDDVPWKKALAFGLVAFVVGFVVTTGFVLVEGVLDESEDLGDDDEDDIGTVNALGWVFYNTHFVDINLDSALGSVSLDLLSELDDDGELSIPSLLWRLIPVFVLTGVGYKLATQLPPGLSEGVYMKRGATLIVGYLPAVIIGLLVFEESFEEGSIAPSFAEGFLIAGVVYPLLWGALGGYLAFRSKQN